MKKQTPSKEEAIPKIKLAEIKAPEVKKAETIKKKLNDGGSDYFLSDLVKIEGSNGDTVAVKLAATIQKNIWEQITAGSSRKAYEGFL